ncbi:LRIT2 [Branchiostoma lanceolatum]|uniref:LRIT2 protein n=1 Tax=Branchiostoma lanceolatum TaxID=7740 RepID=A0A8K0AAQ6_BRALA|nr:LRIT2 [Branchiostoma lanceolatum]
MSTLDVSHNVMTAIPSSVATLRSLQYLKVQHNEITDIQPGMFSNVYYVSELDLSYNNITIIQAGTFANMTIDNDFRLYLSGNPIKHLDKYSFSNIVSADCCIYWFHMDFSNMQLEKIHELAFHNMLQHRWKDCDACEFFFNDNLLETLPSTLCDLYAKPLVYLHLENNPWSCDCRMRDIYNCSYSHFNRITCRYTPILNNARLSSLSPENLVCSNPTIDHISPTVNQLVVGENVTMYCNATGFNRPTITWTLPVVSPSGIPANRQHHDISTTSLDYNSAESTLTIIHVQVTDQGNYTCHASNAAGEDSVSLHLTVISDTKQRQETPHLAAALGCAVGVFILWTILALIYFTHKRRQKTKYTSSSRPSIRETQRGIQHSNPDEDEYDDVRVAKPRGKLTSEVQQRGFHDQRLTEMQGSESGEDAGHLYENPDHVYASLQDDAVTHGGEIERTDGGMARDVREQRRQQDQRARAIQSGESGENAGHTYQGLLHDNPDHDYTSLQGGHDGRTVSNGGGSDQGKGPKKGYKSAPGQATAGFGEDVSHQYQGLRLENQDHVYTSLRNGEATPGDQDACGRQVVTSDDHGHEYSQEDIAAEAPAIGSGEDLSHQYQNAPPDDDYHDYLQLGDD